MYCFLRHIKRTVETAYCRGNPLHRHNPFTVPYGTINSNVQLHINRNVQDNAEDNNDPEDVIASLTTRLTKGNRIYARDLLNIMDKLESDVFEENGLLFLHCCGTAIVDQSAQDRAQLCNEIWEKLHVENRCATLKFYNAYLQVQLENRRCVNAQDFLNAMQCEPDASTLKLLMRIVAEHGDVAQCESLLNDVKSKEIPIDDSVYNPIVLAHAIQGGLTAAKEVLFSMKLSKIATTPKTHSTLLQGLAQRKNHEEFIEALSAAPESIDEDDFIQLLQNMAANDNHRWLDDVETGGKIPELTTFAKLRVENVCIHLIHVGKPEVAFYYYRKFVRESKAEDQSSYAAVLLHALAAADTPSDVVLRITDDLKESGLNALALERVTEAALKRRKFDLAWELFKHFPVLRVHYFWPMLLHAGKYDKEIGVFEAVRKMLELKVKPDGDSLQYYIIPFCDITRCDNLIYRIQKLGFTIREILTPFLGYLLKTNKLTLCKILCKKYNVIVDTDRLLRPLASCFAKKGDVATTLWLLDHFCNSPEATPDCAGQFLMKIRTFRALVNYNLLLELLQLMKRKKLYISAAAADAFNFSLRGTVREKDLLRELEDAANELVDRSGNVKHSFITHPQDMNLQELECHLQELKHKAMNTRGILRKLIQKHCRLGNESRVSELRKEFLDAGCYESPGMKANLMHVFAKNLQTASAFALYNELKNKHADFELDNFKLLDLAACLVANDDFESAVDVLETELVREKNLAGILQNCINLLTACRSCDDTKEMLDLLVRQGYCEANNLTLTPLLRKYMQKNNIDQLMQIYEEIVSTYKCTPLKNEFLNIVVQSENPERLQTALNYISRIQGSNTATISLIVTLAESGLQKSLNRFLLESRFKFSEKELQEVCDKWTRSNNVKALEAFADASKRTTIDVTTIYSAIMKIYSLNNDCKGAVAFYHQLGEKQTTIPKFVVDELLRLVQRCKYEGVDLLRSENVFK